MSFARRTQLIQNSTNWRENANVSTLTCFALVGIRTISGNALRTHYALRNLTDEFDFSLLSPECFVSLTLASGLSGFCALL
jgi:hypothetical protein